MKIHLIKEATIADFTKQYATSRESFRLWLAALSGADWNEAADMKATFGSADILGNGSERVVFDIGGNKYRMICKYYFAEKEVKLYVKWIGTHAAYTKLCNKNEQYSVNDF